MKRCLRSVLIAVLVFTASQLWADPPVCPPFEGFLIETETDVTVAGNMSEEESFDWTWNNANCSDDTTLTINDNALQDGESVARITYDEEFTSFNGLGSLTAVNENENHSLRGDPISEDPTTYHKEFTANSHPDGAYNVVVEKDIGYTSDTTAGHHADFEEVASEEVVSAGGPFETGSMLTGVLALCPWAPSPASGEWPAVNVGVAMGSKFAIPAVLSNGDAGFIDFSSDTAAGVTKGVYMTYDVTATGKGLMQAEMIARLWEGSTSGTTAATPLNSMVTYTEKTSADGLFDFHRGMIYKSKFAPPGVTPIGLEILQ
jgi:hypothetical protein